MSNEHGWFRQTQVVTLELSNLCNLSKVHASCPAHHVQQVHILPTASIIDVFDTLAAHGYGPGKHLAFHVYNEPLLDPRLVKLMECARERMPNVGMVLWSNGSYLHRPIAEDLVDAGATHIMVSAYSDSEFDRIMHLKDRLRDWLLSRALEPDHPVYFQVRRITELDDRMTWATLSTDEYVAPCHQPLSNLTIRANGDIGLCCYDWSHEVHFGNINEQTLAECLADGFDELEQLHLSLAQGKRTVAVCKTCQMPRRPANETIAFNWPESTLISPAKCPESPQPSKS